MRDVIYMFAMSLDGFIARHDGTFDWLENYPADAEFDFANFEASVDGVVMGRGTYDVVRRHEAWPYSRWPTLVATRRPIADLPENTQVSSGEPRQLLDRLGEMGAEGRIWILGGGDLARQFMDAGLLDIIEVGTIPVILGSGITAFGGRQPDRWLDLEFAKGLNNGAVHSRYRVRREAS